MRQAQQMVHPHYKVFPDGPERRLSSHFVLDCRRVRETPMNLDRVTWEYWTMVPSPIAHGDNVVKVIGEKPIHRFGDVTSGIDVMLAKEG